MLYRLLALTTILIHQFSWGQPIFFQDTITFGKPLPAGIDICIDSTSATRWQIGHPHKTVLNDTSLVAIITDTLNPIQPNDTAAFVLRLIRQFDCAAGTELVFTFKTKHDLDYMHDNGFVEISYDSLHWQNWSQPIGNCSFTSGEGIPSVFTGTCTNNCTMGFAYFYLANVGCFPELCLNYPQEDTLFFRFSLISDNINTPKDGWMIDSIFITLYQLESLENNGSLSARILPNPVEDLLNIQCGNIEPTQLDYALMDIKGRLLKMGKLPASGQLSVTYLTPGIYLLRLAEDKGFYQTLKFVKN